MLIHKHAAPPPQQPQASLKELSFLLAPYHSPINSPGPVPPPTPVWLPVTMATQKQRVELPIKASARTLYSQTPLKTIVQSGITATSTLPFHPTYTLHCWVYGEAGSIWLLSPRGKVFMPYTMISLDPSLEI